MGMVYGKHYSAFIVRFISKNSEYYEATNDDEFIRKALPLLEKVLLFCVSLTNYHRTIPWLFAPKYVFH